MLPLGKHLAENGHEVFFQTSDLFASKVEATGMRFVPLLGNANYDYHKLGELIPELRTAQPADQTLIYLKHLFGDRIPDQYRGLEQTIAEKEIDLVITEVLFLGILPLLIGGSPRPPVISFGVTAPLWTDPAFSIFSGPDTTPEGRIRNIADNNQFLAARASGHRYVDGILDRLGFPLPGGYSLNTQYRLPDTFIQLGAEAFEYPMEDRPANLVFSGPLLPKATAPTKTPEWMNRLDPSLPLVLVTQGTLANFDFDQLVNPTLTGLANEPVQVVVTAGDSKSGKIISTRNAIVESYIPYELVLPRTSVFVTNGGYNGVQQALTYGVPIVSCGASEDKPRVAARVSWSGVGIGIKDGVATPQKIRGAVREILDHPRYAERAGSIGAEIAKVDALQTISRIVNETLARTGATYA